MVKTILKESIIVLLLCISILLILSILFYDYNPVGKVIPNKIAYVAPNDIKEELSEENIETEIQIQNKVYTIEGSDLNIYKKSNAYNPSKENPFVSTPIDSDTSSSGNTVKTNINDNNLNNNTDKNSNGTSNGQTTNNQISNGSSNGLK